MQRSLIATKPGGQAVPKRSIDTAWFHKRMEDKRLTLSGLGRLLPKPHSATRPEPGQDKTLVSRKLRGQVELSPADMVALSEALSAPLSEIYARSGLRPPRATYSCQITGVVENDDGIVASLRGKGSTVPAPGAGFEAITDATHNWLLFYRPSPDVATDAIARLAVVEFANGERVIGKLTTAVGQSRLYDVELTLGSGKRLPGRLVQSASPVLWIAT